MQIPVIGSKVLYLNSCDSTNAELARISGLPDMLNGSVVLAYSQTAGKGQRGNSWINEPHKDLTFSFLLNKPDIRSESVFYPLATSAIAVHSYLSQRLPDKRVEIKWPNDILVNGKKICGMLLENTFSGNEISKIIVGIGLNVNGINYPETRFPSTSLALEGEPFCPPEEVLASLLPFINEAFGKLRNNPSFLLNEYNHLLFGKKEQVNIEIKNKISLFKVHSVNFKGQLTLEDSDGNLLMAEMGEIKFLPMV